MLRNAVNLLDRGDGAGLLDLRGDMDVLRLLVERGASRETRDLLWSGTPADWARHAGKLEAEAYLRT